MSSYKFYWFTPTNALRQTPEDIKAWCEKAKINIKLNIEKSGMTVIGKELKTFVIIALTFSGD